MRLRTELQTICDIIHITGRGKGEGTSEEHYWARPFVGADLQHLYAIANIALSRAGAGSIGELAANKIASVFVPLRGVGHDHQQKNAQYVESKGGCILLQQEELEGKLCPLIQQVATDSERREKLAKQLHALHRKNAPQNIRRVLEETLSGKLNNSRLWGA
jgi:UDP-N-acetylglucosamine--N-acetylmuramyl-(pentapeptide) pyrophosphoryl-undecaprenol N-acetylglucosamine transferase